MLRTLLLFAVGYLVGTPEVSPRVSQSSISFLFLPIAVLFYSMYVARGRLELGGAVIAFVAAALLVIGRSGFSLLPSVPYLVVDVLEAGLLAALVRHFATRSLSLRRPERVIVFVTCTLLVPAFTAFVAAFLSTGLPSSALKATELASFWLDWYLGDVTAYLSLGSVLLLARRFWWRRGWNTIRRRPVEFSVALLCLIGAVFYDFEVLPLPEVHGPGSHPAIGTAHPALLFLTFPALLWLAYRFLQLGAAVAILFTTMPSVHLVAMGLGPVWFDSVVDQVILMQGYIIVSAIAACFVAALSFQVRHRERLLARALNLARRRGRSRADFLATMNHEMRTPLNGIIGFSHLMQAEVAGPLPEKYREYVAAIDESSKRLLVLINEVTDLTRMSSGRFDLDTEVLRPAAVVDDICRMLAGVAERGQVRLLNELPVTLTVEANQLGLRHALTNLISNALRHTPADGVVRIGSEVRAESVVLRISDTGEGFDWQAVTDRNRLARGDARAGFGLQITDTIMSLHDGSMTIDSAPGRGCTVSLIFPTGTTRAARRSR